MGTVAETIVQELRVQIDHQIAAADAFDTKGAALAAATFALFTFSLPHVEISTTSRTVAAAVAIVASLGAIASFTRSLRPRTEGFSYGVDAVELIEAGSHPAATFMRAYADGLRQARDRNEAVLKDKANGISNGLWSLLVVGIALAVLLALGGINAGS
jgi:hypothetical protein